MVGSKDNKTTVQGVLCGILRCFYLYNVFVMFPEAYSETCQTSKMERFLKIVNG